MGTRSTLALVAILLVHGLWPTLALAQQPSAGVITTVQGQATFSRPILPQPVPVKFKDDVFFRDRIDTQTNSLVRVLLGGKALVTVRELSTFTVAEEPGRAVVDLQVGKLALGVAKKLLKPGESIEIRTPNSIAAVRGSFLVAEVRIVGGIPETIFTTLQVSLPVTVTSRFDPRITIPLGTNQTVGVSGVGSATKTTPVQTLGPAQVQAVAKTSQAPKPAELGNKPPEQLAQKVSNDKVQEATQLAALLATGPLPSTPPPPSVAPPPPPTSTSALGVQTTAAAQAALTPPPAPSFPLVINGQSLQLTDSLLRSVDGNFAVTGTSDFVAVLNGGSVTTSDTGAPLFQFTGTAAGTSTVTAGGDFLRLAITTPGALAPSMTLSGPLLNASHTQFKNGDSTANAFSFLGLFDSSTLTSTSSSPLLSFNASSVESSGFLFTLRRSTSSSAPTTLTLAGPLFSATNGSSFGPPNRACCGPGFSISQGARLTDTTTAPLIQLANSTFHIGNGFFLVSDVLSFGLSFDFNPANELIAPSHVSLAGSLLSATDSTITSLGSLVFVLRSSLTSTSPDPLIQLSGSTVSLGGTDPFTGAPTFASLLVAESHAGGSNAPAIVSLNGPFLQATNSTLTTSTFAIGVFNGARLISTSTNPFVQLDHTSLTAGPALAGDFLVVSGPGGPGGTTSSSASFAGPLLVTSNGSDVSLQGAVIVGIYNAGIHNATITGTGPGAFIQLSGGSLTTGSNASGAVAALGDGTKLNLQGPLLTAAASTLTLPGGLANISNGGQLTVTGSTDPLVSITGGTHSIASEPGASMFNLTGTNTASQVVDGVPLTLGTDQPLRQNGALLETAGATVSGQQVLRLDTALLAATAPLLNLKAGSTVDLSADAINLVQKAMVTSTGSIVNLDGAILRVASGALFSLNGGSALRVTGDLLTLSNGSTLLVLNGPLLLVNGGSVVNISGALIAFSGTGGNTVRVTNTLCPCTIIGGIPVALTNGALASNVTISGNVIKNPGLGSIQLSSSNTALVVVSGPTSHLTIGGN